MDGWRHVRGKLKRPALKDFFKETARKKRSGGGSIYSKSRKPNNVHQRKCALLQEIGTRRLSGILGPILVIPGSVRDE